MFEIGEKIVYSFYGICKIADIVDKEVGDSTRQYYELLPLADSRSTIYTPIDSKKVLLRSIISRDEAQNILESMDDMEMEWPENVWKRNQEFKLITQNADIRENIMLYKALVNHQIKLNGAGKKMIIQDLKVLETVAKLVCAELTEALGIELEEVELMMKESATRCMA